MLKTSHTSVTSEASAKGKLTGSFVTKEGEVEMFAPVPLKPKNYEAYAKNVNGAIKKRNTMMHSA